MAHNTDAIWRLKLPDDFEPVGTWCVTISVPADQQYVDRLSAALGLLALSKTWARDDTRTGAKTVAHTWEKALYGKPWLVEESECTYADPLPSPVLDTQDDKDDYAAGIIYFIRNALLAPFVTCASSSTPCVDCVSSVASTLAPYGSSDAIYAALANLCTAVKSATPSEVTQAENECVYTDEFAYLSSRVGNAPGWLNELSDWLMAQISEAQSTLFNALQDAASVIGGNGIAGWMRDHGQPTEGSGAGFGGGCAWFIDYYPGHGLSDWTVGGYPDWYDLGTYTSTGWSGEYAPPPQDANDTVTIVSPEIGDDKFLTAMEVTYIGFSVLPEKPYCVLTPLGNGGYPYAQQLDGGTERVFRVDFTEVDTRHCSVYFNNLNSAGGIDEVRRIRLEGLYK